MSHEPLLHILDPLLLHHPELVALRERGGLARWVGSGAPGLARVLLGVTEQTGHPLLDALLTGAGPEMSVLVGMCRGHLMRTLTTTVSLLVTIARILEDNARKDDEDDDKAGEGEGEGAGAAVPAPEDLAARAPEMVEEAFDAVAEQGRVLDALDQMLPDLGWGFGRGHLEAALLQDMARFAELLARSAALMRIADELGRLEQKQRDRKSPSRRGREEVVGVRLGGSLSEVLPAELALLGAGGGAEDLFYQRYIDQRLLSLEYEGAQPEQERRGGEGPVIVCIDTSGSMQGVPEVIAKALVLAVMRRVLPKGRRVRLMLFGGKGDLQDRDIGRGPGAMKHFLDLLAMSFHAGTDFDGPLERALDLLAEERYEQADVLLVTDGYAYASPEVIRRVIELRRELGFSVASVVVGGSPRGVAPFSDRIWTLPASEGALEHLPLEEWHQHLSDDPEG